MTKGWREFVRALDVRLACGAMRLRGRRGGDAGTGPISLSEVRNVLVVRLDEIGDMVLTTPFLRELRRNLPQAAITLVVRPEIRNLVALCPYVDRVVTYGLRTPRSAFSAVAHARRFCDTTFRTESFDLAVVPRWDHDPRLASVLAFQSGARWRLGYREQGLLTHTLDDGPVRHEAARSLDLIRYMGGSLSDEGLEAWLGDDDKRSAGVFLSQAGVRTTDFLLAVAPGAVNPRRRWPIEHFADVAARFRQSHGAAVVVVGGEQDQPAGERLRSTLGEAVINAAGQATLRETVALLTRCTLFIGNDSGPMHLAAAAGIPVVEVSCHPRDGAPSHVNSPVRFGPWSVRHLILQPTRPMTPCEDACQASEPHCIQSITPAEVEAAGRALLSGSY